MPEADVLTLVAAVADGQPIDWESAEESALSDEDRALIRELRHIATLSGLTRTLTEDAVSDDLAPALVASSLPHRGSWGTFTLLDQLGAGAQGVVYRALDLRLRREVALKLRSTTAAATDDHDGYLSEARLLAQVRHPSVVTVYGADLINGRVGLWMELVSGQNLHEIVHHRGPFSAHEAALIGISIGGAVSAVHRAGLLHRDIKAQNVMREAGGRFVLMDFGVGRHLDDTQESGNAGTPLYLAPELLDGAAASVQSEVYALGVLMYFLVSGAYPYAAMSMAALHAAHAQPIHPLRRRRSDLPAAFITVVERALARDPADRFSTVDEFCDAIAATLPQKNLRPSRSRGWWLLAAGIVLAIAAGVGIFTNRTVATIAPASTVAVLPFQDLSPDQSAKYLAEGVTDLLTTALGTRTNLRVLARTTTREFIGSQRPLALAGEVGADRLVEGSVRPDGGKIRVSIRVVHAGSGSTLWGAEFAGDLNALGTLESEMVEATAKQLGKNLAPADGQQRWQADAASMEDYFRGWGEYWRLSREGFAEAQRLFKSAATKSPSFAEAHAAYAYARLTGELSYREATYDEGVREALAAANTALQLNPNSALAEATMGWGMFYVDWDWKGAETHLRRAVDLNPSDAQVRWMYGQLLMAENRLDAALAEGRLCQRLDPLNPARHSNVATVLYYGRQFTEAADEMKQVLLKDPNAGYARFGLSRMYSAMGRHDEALGWMRSSPTLAEPWISAEYARQLLAAGRESEARALIRTAELDYHAGRLQPDYLAFVKLAENDVEGALALLNEAVTVHSGTVIWVHVDPRYDALREDIRFVDILRRLGLAPALR
jgi:TolB-like protein/Tfp pilus assembly protein PilF